MLGPVAGVSREKRRNSCDRILGPHAARCIRLLRLQWSAGESANPSATSIGAEVLQFEGKVGCVAADASADLIVVDGDPLQDIGLVAESGRSLSLIVWPNAAGRGNDIGSFLADTFEIDNPHDPAGGCTPERSAALGVRIFIARNGRSAPSDLQLWAGTRAHCPVCPGRWHNRFIHRWRYTRSASGGVCDPARPVLSQ